MTTYTTIMFDLDDTLAESKSPLSEEMAALLVKLLTHKKVAIISGGALSQFTKQIADRLPKGANMNNLYFLPTCGAALYVYDTGTWKEIYAEHLSKEEAAHIERVIRDAATESGIIDFTQPSWGERIEFRNAQVTLSALGQQAPVEAKKPWDPDHAKRDILAPMIAERLPEYSVKIGGATSIDVTKKGIDKAYGVRKLSEFLHEPIARMLYVGDALFPGGNDEVVKESGIATKEVANPKDTARLIEELIKD